MKINLRLPLNDIFPDISRSALSVFPSGGIERMGCLPIFPCIWRGGQRNCCNADRAGAYLPYGRLETAAQKRYSLSKHTSFFDYSPNLNLRRSHLIFSCGTKTITFDNPNAHKTRAHLSAENLMQARSLSCIHVHVNFTTPSRTTSHNVPQSLSAFSRQ